MEIKDRIEHIIKAKNLTATQFAEEINIQRSGISHILSGRNNPSMDFILKVKETFPEYSLDWLLLGKGPITVSTVKATKAPQPSLFEPIEDSIPQKESSIVENVVSAQTLLNKESEPPGSDIIDKAEVHVSANKNASREISERHLESIKKIVRMILIYDDQTFSILENSDN
ncbi:MAG: helix-turn-helix transcriptional regulator [Bacteroidales bacterium]|nr:helix-turn-helix transcriptional regulator [Bacteroidales bacterium]